jgi:hypothetical protein
MTGGYLVFTDSPANGEHAGKALHVVIAEWMLGRPLLPKEIVHHVNCNKRNNDPGNLEVMSHSNHASLHAKANQLGVRKHVGKR